MRARRVKGQGITIEALIVGMASLIIIAFALRFASSLMVNPVVTQGRLEGRLCGAVLIVTNTGTVPVTVDNAVVVYTVTGRASSVAHLLPPTIQPGSSVKANLPLSPLDGEPDYVVIAGRDFPAVIVRNECKG